MAVLPFFYTRLPGGIDCVLQGYVHNPNSQKENREFLSKIAKNAQVCCIEGNTAKQFGDSLEFWWSNNVGLYDVLMRDAVENGFGGLFAEIDIRDHLKIAVDSNIWGQFPNLPDEFFQKYFEFLQKYFPVDAVKIKDRENLKEILKRLSTTEKEAIEHDISHEIDGIDMVFPAYVDEDIQTNSQMTGLEYGERYFRDAMASIKLHLIAKEMYEGRIDKGVIVDFDGTAHMEPKFFYLRNPLLALMTVLKNPHLIQVGELARKNDISSIYPAFSPDEEMFKRMFTQIYRLEFARPEKEEGRTEIEPGLKQMPMKKFEIPGRDEMLKEMLGKLDVGEIIAGAGAK